MSQPSLTKTQPKEVFEQALDSNKEVGFVQKINPPIVYVTGLPHAFVNEVVYFESGQTGFVSALLDDFVEVVMLSSQEVSTGTRVSRSGNVLKIGVGPDMLGHTLDGLGGCLYTEDKYISVEQRSVECKPLPINHRERIKAPLITGVSFVDLLIPLGKGQRELVIGDRNIGKTSFVLQVLRQQASGDVICIYACIGKKQHSVKKVEQFIKDNNIQKNVVILAAASSDPLGLVYLTPYAAMTVAEYFRDLGKDVLLILDDLTNHAKYYRELSLVSRNFPGRDSYPGNVFYVHSHLLERAGNFRLSDGKVASITCLPIVETVDGDISGYIQTNLMSITDGHLFFDSDLFKSNRRPAINYFLSVTRVGRQTQDLLRWNINRELASFFVLYNKTERFIHFGSELNEGIRATLQMGDKLNRFFNQDLSQTFNIELEIFAFASIWSSQRGFEQLDTIPITMASLSLAYEKNSVLKEKVDQVVHSSKDLNTLLSNIRSSYSSLPDFVSKDYEKN
jgi:F-type H+-transporting ATPase subunit alpha